MVLYIPMIMPRVMSLECMTNDTITSLYHLSEI